VRGEGAILLNKNMERFTDELQPRDIVTKAIREQMIEDGAEHVWEDLRPIPEDELKAHFPNIVEHCRKKGYDVTKEPIPVVPAQHYFMGGIDVNYFSKTTMDRLYAIGETACNGVHGKNRLASNSLLESLVFAKRAALDMKNIESLSGDEVIEAEALDLTEYQDAEAIKNKYKELVLNAIQNAREESERNV
jgi:L-aspartate oxidase